tara:strand:+ start:1492 stop:1683 length:192 start_codon:yes stop_codon:yes gene_type:complete
MKFGFLKKKTDQEKADELNEQIARLQEQAKKAKDKKQKKKIYNKIIALNNILESNYQGVALRL